MTTFTVYLNREETPEGRLAIFDRFRSEDAYQPGDKLEAVYTGDQTRDDESQLDAIFPMFNRGSGTFVGDDVYPQRSLSAGDVVRIGATFYACESVGWKQVVTPACVDLADVAPSLAAGARP